MTRASTTLDDLARRYWDFRCHEFPIGAIMAGVTPDGNALTRDAPEDFERRAAWAARALEELDGIGCESLSRTERATHSLLRGELAGMVDGAAQSDHLRPSISPLGPEFQLSTWASMTSLATVEDARRYVTRLGSIADSLADQRRCLMLGHERGYRYPRLVAEQAVGVVRAQASAAIEASAFFAPLHPLLARSNAFKSLVEEGRAVIAGSVVPAFDAYADFIRDVLVPAATDDLARTADLNGEEHYRFLIRQFTTIDMPPEDIHATGLAEVARIADEMEAVAAAGGFAGDLAGFRRRLQTDASQFLASGEALREALEALAKRIDARIPEFFGRLPRSTYGVKSIPKAIAAAVPPAYAQPNPADNSAAGFFWVTPSASRLPCYMHLPLTLHEAWPGHLMHLALIQELDGLPEFRRHGALNYSACLEGWALYCEWLGEDMGLYDTPEKRYGRLEMEMWRAVRLVVDTGLHANGWSRKQAIDFFCANIAMPLETIEAEVDRYIGLPGQALGYQLGNMKFRELRTRAEQVLGDRFNIRAFNDALASAGAVSLPVLEQTIDDWLRERRQGDTVAA